MARLNWAKNEQLRRRQRLGSEPIGQIDVSPYTPIVSLRTKQRKGKKAKRRPTAQSTTANETPKAATNPDKLSAPDAPDRFRQELAQLDQEIFRLEKELLRQRKRRVAVTTKLKKIVLEGKPIHAGKLIPAVEAASRPLRRRKKNVSSPPPREARKNS